MVETRDFDPDDAIISLSPNRNTFDAVKYIVSILRDNWEQVSTNGITPQIDFAEALKAVMFRGRDFIGVYAVSQITEPVTIIYDFTNEVITFSLDMTSSGDREHFMRMYEEVRRIIYAFRRDTIAIDKGVTGRMWMEWEIRSTPLERDTKGFYHRIVDCRINWRYRAIRT